MEKLTAKAFEPDEGFWKSYTEDVINSVVEILREAKLEDEKIYSVISGLISTIKCECGE